MLSRETWRRIGDRRMSEEPLVVQGSPSQPTSPSKLPGRSALHLSPDGWYVTRNSAEPLRYGEGAGSSCRISSMGREIAGQRLAGDLS